MDAIVVTEPEARNEAYTALTGSFEIPFEDWNTWNEKIDFVSVDISGDKNLEFDDFLETVNYKLNNYNITNKLTFPLIV